MSENQSEQPQAGQDPGPSPVTGARSITDDQLPEDLRPSEDNPLAQPPDEDDGDTGLSLQPEEGAGEPG